MASMTHFLLVYSYAEQRLVEVARYSDADEATLAYRNAETTNRGKYDELEIVLVGADSIETIHRTHGHYFMDRSQRMSLEDLLV